MALKQCYFCLRDHTQFLGSLGAGLFGAVCAFSEKCSFQWRLLLLQLSVDRERHAACLLFVHTCCVCILGAVYACLLCIQACCTYKFIVYARLLCMCECCVCTITMYAQHTCYVCMLEAVYACLRVRNSRTHSLVPCGVGEEHWAGLYIHQESVYASQMRMLHSVARPSLETVCIRLLTLFGLIR